MTAQTIGDVARTDVVTAQPGTDARDLARQMRDEGIGSLVIEVDSHPIGIVTDRDLTVQVLAEDLDRTATLARELMTEYPTTITADMGIEAATRQMDEHGVRRLPVVDESDTLEGIVALDDIYRELVAEHEHLADVVAAESPD